MGVGGGAPLLLDRVELPECDGMVPLLGVLPPAGDRVVVVPLVGL